MSKSYKYILILIIAAFAACDYEVIPDEIGTTLVSDESPIADFTFDESITYYENCTEVQFINNSQNATSYLWEFGDEANTTSTDENPKFTYEKAGNYIATLSINGSDISTTKELSISEVKGTENYRNLSEADGYYDIVAIQKGKYLITGYTNLYETRDAHLAVINSDAGLTNSWTFEADRSNLGFAVAISNNNYFIAVRTYPLFSNPFNTNIIKLSSSGAVFWDLPFKAPDDSNIDPLDIIPDDDGGVILTGSVEHGDSEKVFIMKVSSSGVRSNFYIYEEGKGYSIIKTANGDIAVGGVSPSSEGIPSAYFLLINKNGSIKAEKTLQYRNYETEVRELKQTNDGFIMAGFVHLDEVEYDIYMAKIDAAGNVEWQQNYLQPGDQIGTSIVPTTDGRYIVVGQNGHLLNTNELGEPLSPIKKITNGRMFSILSDDCHFIMAGRDENDQFLILKTDSEGNIN